MKDQLVMRTDARRLANDCLAANQGCFNPFDLSRRQFIAFLLFLSGERTTALHDSVDTYVRYSTDLPVRTLLFGIEQR